ncbi:hypothetical protein [Microbacterium testaceum]|uniref:hypothetical protein n=1 Tax=Microbacterium testaceum TaxID=2033 RepID=UPI002AC739EF|nr:hypothetical protein [Microbacterium testaceum]MDZ5146341.1 hypothetical protein [Microbacterium testaceum]
MRTIHRRSRERWSGIRGRLSRDDGWAGTAILWIGSLTVLLIGFQAAFWFNGVNVAQAAAQSGYTISRAYESNADAGQAAARQLINGIPGSLRDPTVTIIRTADTVTVTVTGRVAMLVPGIELPPVTYTLTGPVERWVPAP